MTNPDREYPCYNTFRTDYNLVQRKEVQDMCCIQIAICDDETKELDKVEAILRSYHGKYGRNELMLRRFEDSTELLYMIGKGNYSPDLILMDIYMPHNSGIETAKRLREQGNACRIIFLTSSRDYALDAFEVNAFQYLLKPVSEKRLFPVIEKAFHDIENEQPHYILLRVDNHVRRVALGDIVYCEAQGKKQCIYLKDGETISLRMTMVKLREILSGCRECTKVGGSYIVNLEHIERMSAQELRLDNGKEIYLPRGAYKSLREIYFNHYFGGREEFCI